MPWLVFICRPGKIDEVFSSYSKGQQSMEKKKGKVLFRCENGFFTALVRGITLHSTSENDCSAEIVLAHSIFNYAQRNI